MTLRDKAIQTALTGDWKEAISTNKELLDDNPEDIDALNRLALAFTILGKTTSAKTTYQKVLKVDPLNPIALRNLKNLKTSKIPAKNLNYSQGIQINNQFIEETGKTKVVELLNLAQANIIQSLRTGELVNLSIKRSRIFVLKGEKQYIGVLPDDIGKRLIKFMKSGNKYEAYTKSANAKRIIIFIKEVKRSPRFKNQPSFQAIQQETNLFDKEKIGGIKTAIRNQELEDLEEDDGEETDL
ncbi:MAG TPA: hypothetical protein VFA93_02710 [Patescibacteria group bacterium]|nr:hypothetical protein [Patescibacteria group bacterium]